MWFLHLLPTDLWVRASVGRARMLWQLLCISLLSCFHVVVFFSSGFDVLHAVHAYSPDLPNRHIQSHMHRKQSFIKDALVRADVKQSMETWKMYET